jgi:polyhydroxybutyrate depolymerase
VRLRAGLGVALAALALGAQQERPRPGETVERTIKVGAQDRTYLLRLPKDFTAGKPVPLVVCLHGAGATGKIQQALSGFDAAADRHGFAVAYPDGRRKMWVFVEAGRISDTGFLRALVDALIDEGVADRQRVYFTGISNGAYMSNTMGAAFADRIAAIAPIAGTMMRVSSETARPKRALPVLYIHGTEDKLISYDGKDFISRRESSLSAEALVQWWARKNGCADKPETEKLPDKEKDDTTVERITYAGGEKGAPVVFYKITGGGHTWPGGFGQPEKMLGNVCRDINATEVIWEFFSKHALPGP